VIRPYLRERILETREGSKRFLVPVRVGENVSICLVSGGLRFEAFYWVGILAEISPDEEIAARLNLKAREVES
jgi:hypothetical protein